MANDVVPGQHASPVGAALKRLRRLARLTGQQLADRVGMSQAKISRIENGVGHVKPEDVRSLAEALGASGEIVDELVEQAEQAEQAGRADDRMADWRPARGAVATMQLHVAELEATTTEFRVFQPAVIVGLAQTSEYARAVLGNAQSIRAKVGGGGTVAAVPEAVSARVRRQEILADPAKQFHFVMTESVLTNRFGRPEDMPAQIRRLREVADQPNVSMRLVPADRELPIPPYHGFEILDDRCVLVDIFNTTLTAWGERDTTFYRQVFDAYENEATEDIAPILDRHLEIYLDRSRPSAVRRSG
jgi:transcriptional regulator with XRE-family HTH domain